MYGLRSEWLKTRVDEALQMIGFTERDGGLISKFFGGIKRRVNIAVALLHRPMVPMFVLAGLDGARVALNEKQSGRGVAPPLCFRNIV